MAERAVSPRYPGTTRVKIIGHSYVRRLKESMPDLHDEQQEFQANFGLSEMVVSYYGISGGTIEALEGKINAILIDRPNIIVMQVGRNDFMGGEEPDHTEVPHNLIRLAKDLRRGHTGVVIIGKLFYRKSSRHLPTDLQVGRYNEKVQHTNEVLQSSAKRLQEDHILVWNHKGRQLMRDEIIGQDGTHLNQLGMKEMMVFRPLLCTLFRRNWAKQTPGIMRRN